MLAKTSLTPSTAVLTPHSALRHATQDWHARLDALFAGFDLAHHGDYGAFLQAHAAAALPVESALDHAGVSTLLPDWPLRGRSALLVSDLAALGLKVPEDFSPLAFETKGALWGAAYVLEGSRLGGTVLAKRLALGLPRQYLTAAQPSSAWPQFLKQLDAALQSPLQLEHAVAAAQDTFALFETAGRQQIMRRECERTAH